MTDMGISYELTGDLPLQDEGVIAVSNEQPASSDVEVSGTYGKNEQQPTNETTMLHEHVDDSGGVEAATNVLMADIEKFLQLQDQSKNIVNVRQKVSLVKEDVAQNRIQAKNNYGQAA